MSTHDADIEQQLAAVPMFSKLSKRARRSLLEKSSVVDHTDGHVVAAEGKGSLAMHVVLSGTAAVSKHGDRVVRRLGPGDYFGEISLLDGKPRSATVSAEGRLTTLAIPQHAVKGIIEHDPEFAHHLMLLVCARLRTAEAALDEALADRAGGGAG